MKCIQIVIKLCITASNQLANIEPFFRQSGDMIELGDMIGSGDRINGLHIHMAVGFSQISKFSFTYLHYISTELFSRSFH